MKLFTRLFGSPEVKAGLGVLDELQCVFASPAFDLVRPRVEGMILAQPAEFSRIVQQEMPARRWVLAAAANTAADMLESGNYHIYRGMLNPLGPGYGLLHIYNTAIAQLVQMGVVTSEVAQHHASQLRENMKGVG